MAHLIKTGKECRNTWLGRPGQVFALHFDHQPKGKRVSIHTWDDDRTVEIRAIFEDGRGLRFKLYEEKNLGVVTREEAIREALDMANRVWPDAR